MDIEKSFANLYDNKHELIRNIQNDLISQLEKAFIEGLKRKGFEFETKFALEQFVKKHCKCLDNNNLKERVYTVDDIPFLLHKYETKISNPVVIDRTITITATNGYFGYL